MSIDSFICAVAGSLDSAARAQFGKIEEITLRRAMDACGMKGYPIVTGDPDGMRTSGDMVCDRCGREYGAHPMDWRVIGYGDVPFLNVLCDGTRVKL